MHLMNLELPKMKMTPLVKQHIQLLKIKMSLFLLILSISCAYGSSLQDKFLGKPAEGRNLISSSCKFVSFAESYKVSYKATGFTISPTFNMRCESQLYEKKNVQVSDSSFRFNQDTQKLELIDWSSFVDNSFYNVSLTFTVANTNKTYDSNEYQVQGYFMLTMGTIQLQLRRQGSILVEYNDDITVSYLDAFDPEQPLTGKLIASWTCPPLFLNCQSLGLYNKLTAIDRLNYYGVMYGVPYNFNVTITNVNSGYRKSSTDSFDMTVIEPNQDFSPQSCINFKLQFQNQAFKLVESQPYANYIYFDNGNYSDIVIVSPSVDVSACSDSIKSMKKIVVTQMTSTTFFSHSLYFFNGNSGSISISKERLAQSLSSGSRQLISFFVILTDGNATTTSNAVTGFTYKQLGITVSSQTLYAQISPPTSFSITMDKILYLDGSNSYDVRASSSDPRVFNYIWNINGFSNIQLNNTMKLALDPAQRAALGINQPGKSYTYTLAIKDSTRLSSTVSAQVSIAPSINPRNCITVALKDINLEQIMTYLPQLPMAMQVRVIMNPACQNVIKQRLVWSCDVISYQFWGTWGNDNTILIDKNEVRKLPKSRDIPMAVTQYYSVDGIDYIARQDFILIIQRDGLVPVLNYPTVVNIKDENIVIDASSSYDPSAEAMGTTDVPINCKWTCPPALSQVCNYMYGCQWTLTNSKVKESTNYQDQIVGQSHLFKLTITKDSRQAKKNFFITLVEGASYPKCQINIEPDYQFNFDTFMNASCSTTTTASASTSLSFRWTISDWTSLIQLEKTASLQLNQQKVRVPPYYLSASNEIVIRVDVTQGNFTTPINLYYLVNVPSNINQGSLQINFNSFPSYLAPFIVLPTNWKSLTSYSILYQLRYKNSITSNNYKVLISQTEDSAGPSLSSILPPLTAENKLYVDVFTLDGDFITQELQIISKVNPILTPNTFAYQVMSVVGQIIYSFNENSFESSINALSLAYQAYQTNNVDTTTVDPVYFTTVCASTIQYLNNTFQIDQRLKNVVSKERQVLIKQNIIEILFAITNKQMYMPFTNEILNLIQLVTLYDASSPFKYSLGSNFVETTKKAMQTIITTMDSGKNQLQYIMLLNLYKALNNYMMMDEYISSTSNDWPLYLVKVNKKSSSLPSIPGFSQSQLVILQNTIQTDSTILFMCGSAVIYNQDSGQVQGQQQLAKCIRPDKQNPQTTINNTDTANSTNTTNGTNSSQNTGPVTVDPLWPDKDSVQQASGTWTNQSDTGLQNQQPNDLGPNPYIKRLQPALIPVGGLLVIGLFVISTMVIYKKYEYERYEMTLGTTFKYPNSNIVKQNESLLKQRLGLLKILLKQFSPYLNLFLIKNKFLPRWVRTIILQLYFMSVSSVFIMILAQSSDKLSSFDVQSSLMFWVVIFACVFLRPLTNWLIQVLFYEPDALVEDIKPYLENSEMSPNQDEEQEQQQQNMEADYSQYDNKFATPNMAQQKDKQHMIGVEKFNFEQNREQMAVGAFDNENEQQRQNTNSNQNAQLQDQNSPANQEDHRVNTTMGDIEDHPVQQSISQANLEQNRANENNSLDESIRIVDDSFIEECYQECQQNKIDKQNNQDEVDFAIFEGGESEHSIEDFGNNSGDDQGCATNMRLSEKPLQGVIDECHQDDFQTQFKNACTDGPALPSIQSTVQDLQNSSDNNDSQVISPRPVEDIVELSSIDDGKQKSNNKLQTLKKNQDDLLFNFEDNNDEFQIEIDEQFQGDSNSKRYHSPDRKLERLSPRNDNKNTSTHGIKSNGKPKLYINKLVGKGVLGIIWGALILIHVICLYHLRRSQFQVWLTLSIIAYSAIILLIDPIIYFILSCYLIPNIEQQGLNFGAEKRCFIKLFIGIAKMKDLKKALILENKSQNYKVTDK